MKYRALDFLRSVPDGKPLRLTKMTKMTSAKPLTMCPDVRCQEFCALRNCRVSGGITASDCAECYAHEIIEGELRSESGSTYPVTGGIPRMLSGGTTEFLRKNQASFSLEWKYFRFGERNWGQDIEFRKQLFVKGMGRDAAELRGRTILDAGCGSGLLSIEMANSFGMEVIALDLATGIEQAYSKNTNPRVHFVQASVLEPPLRKEVADFVYCAGVLVTLPSSRQGFECLSPCVKPNGRFFIWLYHPIENHRQTGDYSRELVYDWMRRRVTSRLPIRLQEIFYLCLLPPYFLKRTLLNPFRPIKENRTWREKMQGFIDHFSPMYMNRHTVAEATEWYLEQGFTNVEAGYRERYGFGMRGDRLRNPPAPNPIS